ncbi:MAG: C4-type zinc ribbon domain-containing protein [Bacteroidales bacterium]|nr:C4-type zinc ribbon domain-containing protein [Bacteroidales bacterium]MCL2133599.1 C4-type zinc ribbon domain-containing protein [Bacteroidales bacterium]
MAKTATTTEKTKEKLSPKPETAPKKSVTDTDISMESKLKLLYKLQQTDSKIDEIRLLRGELPLEVRDLEDHVQGLKTRVTNFQAEIKELEAAISKKKVEIENSKALVKKYESQQNNVKNNREYDSITKEIEYQNLEIELAEKRIKEHNADIKERKVQLENAKTLLAERTQDLAVKKKELDEIIAETSKEEKELLVESTAIAEQLEERLVRAYQRVRGNARNGLAVVTVKRDACGGCFNKIPPQRQLDICLSKKIIVCEYCGRILVDEGLVGDMKEKE